MSSSDDRKQPKQTGFEDAATPFLHKSSNNYVPQEQPENEFEDDPFVDLVGSGGVEAAFTADDARSRRGNYIIPFGLPGSGKTTFLASLFKYIDESPGLSNQILIPERRKVPNYAGQAMLNQWQKVFNSGRFLGATLEGDDAIRELTYEVTPLKGQKTKLTFSVVEVSGEDLLRVIAREGSDPRLPAALEALFKNSRVRTMIVLVVHPNKLENDILFNNLFTWLNRVIEHRCRTFSLAVLIANPDLALQRLHKRRPDTAGQTSLSGQVSKVYLKEFAPKTFAVFNSWVKDRRAIIPFYVGEITTFSEGEETFERVTKFDQRHSAQIFSWIYHQFTRKKLGATTLQRIFRILND